MSVTIFNIVVHAVVQDTLMEVCGPQESQHGLVWAAREQDVLFYYNDGRIVGRNPIWVQGTFMARIQMFYQLGIYTNLCKTNSMTCTPGFIWVKMGKEAYKLQAIG